MKIGLGYRVSSFLVLSWILLITVAHSDTGDLNGSLRDQFNGTPREWSEVLEPETYRKLAEFGVKLTDVIFNAIHNVDTKIYGSSHFNVGITVNRNVFNNRDAEHTWSVVDKIRIGGGVPIFGASVPLGGGLAQLGFFIGTSAGVEITDMRRVSASRYEHIQPERKIEQTFRSQPTYHAWALHQQRRLLSSSQSDQTRWIPTTDRSGTHHSLVYFPDDGANYARYSELWNLGLVPFKLPLTVDAFHRLEDGEIISYLGEGSIELGASVGWNIDPSGLVGMINAGVSLSTFVRGSYRLSVLRQSESVAQVKVTRVQSQGTQTSVGGGYSPGLIDSVIVINNFKNVLQVYPVQINVGHQQSTVFEVTYEYDLNTLNGRLAYERAVLGSFKSSDDLAINSDGRWKVSLRESGVRRLSNQVNESVIDQFDQNMKLTLAFSMNQHAEVVDTVTTLFTPDGRKRTLTSIARNTKEWRTLFAQYESTQHNFMIRLDLDECEKDPYHCESLSLDYETRIEDSNLTQQNLLYSLLEMENALNKVDLIPRTPLVRDIKNLRRDALQPFFLLQSGHDLGPASLFYQVSLTADQMRQIIDYPQAKMWSALEKAFHVTEGSWSNCFYRFFYYLTRSPVTLIDIPLNLLQVNLAPGTNLAHAQRIYKQWNKLKSLPSIQAQSEALARMFSNAIYGRELTQLVRAVLEGSDVRYRFSASNQAFGQLSEEGQTQLTHQEVSSLKMSNYDLNRSITVESERNPMMWIYNLAVRHYSSQEQGLFLSLSLPMTPNQIYIDLFSIDSASLIDDYKFMGSKIIRNDGVYIMGHQLFPILPQDPHSPLHGLVSRLKSGAKYQMRMALSHDGIHWGRVSEVLFTL